jgi:hypothetical protein
MRIDLLYRHQECGYNRARCTSDFMLERHSRESFGGLPSGEYVLHIILAMLFGALVMSKETVHDY